MLLRTRSRRYARQSDEDSLKSVPRVKRFYGANAKESEDLFCQSPENSGIEKLNEERVVFITDAEDSTPEVVDVETYAIADNQIVDDIATTSSEHIVTSPCILSQSSNAINESRRKRKSRVQSRRLWFSRTCRYLTAEDNILGPSKYRRKRQWIPDVNELKFKFTGHHKLLPYLAYYDIIMRAKNDHSIINLDIPKLRPPAGSIVVYDCKGTDLSRQIHSDGYRWGRSKGVKQLSSVDNRLVRTYYFLFCPDNPAGDAAFKKYRFGLRDDPYGIIVFHYLGDEKRALEVSEECMDRPNAIILLERGDGRQDIEGLLDLNLVPLDDNVITEDDIDDKRKQNLHLNVHMIRKSLLYNSEKCFVDNIEVSANTDITSVILFCHPLMDQLMDVSSFLQQGNPLRTILLFYHTEPCSANYYLSTLSFAHPFFEGEHIIPVAFMISRCLSGAKNVDHNYFLTTVYERFSDLQSGRFVIVTGQNLHFNSDSFPVAEHFRCWIDFKRIKMAYLEAISDIDIDAIAYASDMNILMSCHTEKKFDEAWGKISTYKRYIDFPDVLNYFVNVWIDFKFTSAVWNLKHAGVPEAEKGIIWRGSDDLKKIVVQLCDNNAEVDTIALSLYLLCNAYRRLVTSSTHHCGVWRLKKCYRERFQLSDQDLPKLPYAPAMESIVLTSFKYCTGRIYKNTRGNNPIGDKYAYLVASDPSGIYISAPQSHSAQRSCQIRSGYRRSTNIASRNLADMKQIDASVRLLNPMTFVVRSESGVPHVVEATQNDHDGPLQWYCSCGCTEQCQHVKKTLFKVNE